MNFQGSADGILDYEKSILKLHKFVLQSFIAGFQAKFVFLTIHYIKILIQQLLNGAQFNKTIPDEIIKEVEEKSKLITYDLKWKKGDLLMIDNKRFMHGRRSFKGERQERYSKYSNSHSKFWIRVYY